MLLGVSREGTGGARRASIIGPSGIWFDVPTQRLVVQTNNRRGTMPVCSPFTCCLAVASPETHGVSNMEKLSNKVCARDLASTADDKARPRPRTHCAGEYPLSSMAKLQAQLTAVVSHFTRCIWSATNLTLDSSIRHLACVFQTPPCRSQTAFCCGVMAAVGMSSQPMSLSSCPKSHSAWRQFHVKW